MRGGEGMRIEKSVRMGREGEKFGGEDGKIMCDVQVALLTEWMRDEGLGAKGRERWRGGGGETPYESY